MNVKLRAKRAASVDLSKIECANIADPLVPIVTTEHMIVEPIWIKPTDDIEGPLMKDYVETHQGYNQIYTRQEIKRRLIKSSESLPSGMKLIIRAGHRPVEVQLKLLKSLLHRYLLENPKASRHVALAHARQYVSDPTTKLPPHCCGAAVDVDLFDTTRNRLVDFGCPVNTDSEVAFLFSDQITARQRGNRMLLAEVMLQSGFACYYHEWWHYSYGDQLWASFYNQPAALYGIADGLPR